MRSAIFILGILQRSGTNFLSDLLRLHPDCTRPEPIWEDFVNTHAHLLVQYSEATRRKWDPQWGVGDREQRELSACLGNGILEFLWNRAPDDGRRLVTKTPSVRRLEHFFELFPDQRLLIIVRDGRSVVESGARSFGWRHEEAARKWDRAARTILRFREENQDRAGQYLLVRYEDLYRNARSELERILRFLELDEGKYDFEEAVSLPIRGSSDLRRQGDQVHWEPIAKDNTFDPLRRWHQWSSLQHRQFNAIAGQSMQQLGYELVCPPSGLLAAVRDELALVRQKLMRRVFLSGSS